MFIIKAASVRKYQRKNKTATDNELILNLQRLKYKADWNSSYW